MRTAYLTLDEVNAHRAIDLGRSCGQVVHLVDLRSPDPGDEAFLVIDMDYVPASEHPRLFELLLPQLAERLAVHGYNLSTRVKRRLAKAGVIVRRRLDVSLFQQLARRSRVPQTTIPRRLESARQ
jgi:hypothetical protein